MQTETQKTDLKALVRAGLPYSAPPIEPEPETKEKISYSFRDMIDAAEKLNPRIKHNKPDYSTKSDEEKKTECTRNSGKKWLMKWPDGRTKEIPNYCKICERCHKARARQLQARVDEIVTGADNSDKDGVWRMKTVDRGTEAQSLKKRIKRNQDGAHFECASPEPGKVNVWSYVADEPGKDMDKIYGKNGNPQSIDFEDLRKLNKESGQKFSTGSAFKKKSSAVKKEDTERVIIPQIILKNASQEERASRIIEETNYIELAKNSDHARRLVIFQFKYIIRELEKANIKIAAIKLSYYNIAKDELLEGWNKNIKFWMSINASKSKNLDPKMDITSHLIFPKSKKADIAIQ